VQGFHAARIDRIGVHGLIMANEAEAEVGGHDSFRIPGGYAPVIHALHDAAVAAGALLRLNTIVESIQWSTDGVEVDCLSNGIAETFKASRVLITLPLGVLQESVQRPMSNVQSPSDTKSEPEAVATGPALNQLPGAGNTAVRFVPDLPEEKQAAIRGVEMGDVVRMVLRFRERFWEKLSTSSGESLEDLGFIHYPEAPLPTWWSLLHIRAPILVGWSGGANAELLLEAELSQDELLNEALKSLQIIFGLSESKLRHLLVSFHMHDWKSDPFTRGAYAYLPVDGLKAQQSLAHSVNNVLFFAGEAMSVGHIGTVHGAIETGIRAAQEILDAEGVSKVQRPTSKS
jgi:monoamine oxidase